MAINNPVQPRTAKFSEKVVRPVLGRKPVPVSRGEKNFFSTFRWTILTVGLPMLLAVTCSLSLVLIIIPHDEFPKATVLMLFLLGSLWWAARTLLSTGGGRTELAATFKHPLRRPRGDIRKVILDLTIAILLVVILAPMMLLIAVFVALDGGPVLYRHMRIGMDGERFYCLKFRSMTMGADQVLAKRLAEDPAAREEWVITQKLTNDPRVTRIGRFLRATSLDELPQIFNVLKLEMSLVGPSPIVENELPRYGRRVNYYLQVRPGVTGLWQVSGRSNTSYSRRVALDAWYVKNWTFWLDLRILLRTWRFVVLAARGH